MILAVDIGNTHIVIGCLEGKEIRSVSRIATNRLGTQFEYAVIMDRLLELGKVDRTQFDGSILSSVVPQLTETLAAAIEMVSGTSPLIVGTGLKTGVNIRIDDPAQVGSDLVVEAAGAIGKYKAPIIIYDLGTATTIIAIDEKNTFLGGAIAPGVRLSLDALSSGTSQLPYIQLEPPAKAIGTNTIDSMKSGAILGAAAMLDGMVERMEEELGTRAQVVATGGLAGRVVPHCKRKDIIIDDNLVLEGLAVIYAKNRKNRT